MQTPAQPPVNEDYIKGPVQDWQGGRPLNLKRKMKSGKKLREDLSAHLKENLDQELKNQENVVKRLQRWLKLYKAEGKEARPKPWMASVSIPEARQISDTIFVRIHDMVWNKQRVYMFRARGNATKEQNDNMLKWEKAFNNYIRNDVKLKNKMRFPTRQCVNAGTGIGKIVYEVVNKPIYRYASPIEQMDETVTKYKVPGTVAPVIKEPRIVFQGPNFYPLDRAKFVISSDASSIEDAYLVGFSFNKRKAELKTLSKKGIYDKDSVDKILSGKFDETTEDRAKSAGSELQKTKYTEPYELYEIWFKYDVDDDGEEDDIVVTFHRDSGQILKAIYNPIFYGYRPFVDMKGASQVEYTYDGEGICEIVECMNEELDTLHRLMLDRMKLANLPIVFAREGIGLDNYELEPGKVKAITGDPVNDIRILEMPDITFSIVNEVNWIVSKMEMACGITPGALGVSTAERPVFKETALNQEEYNKKFKNWTDCAREFYNETGYKMLEAFAQYQPKYSYIDETGQQVDVEMPTGNIRDFINLDLAVSSEEWNMTMRRDVELLKYQLLSDYLTKVAGMVQALTNPNVPSDFKKFVVQVNDIGSRSLTKVLSNFEDTESESTDVDIRKSVDVDKCVKASPDVMQLAMQTFVQGMVQQQQAAQQEQGGGEQAGPMTGGPTPVETPAGEMM